MCGAAGRAQLVPWAAVVARVVLLGLLVGEPGAIDTLVALGVWAKVLWVRARISVMEVLPGENRSLAVLVDLRCEALHHLRLCRGGCGARKGLQ